MEERRNRVGIFMAFGTQGDVYPIAALATAFALDQKEYRIFFMTHSAHQNLSPYLDEVNVRFISIKSPPTLSTQQDAKSADSEESLFDQMKTIISIEQRQDCFSAVESILGGGSCVDGSFILINYFALEGWNLAEAFHVRCVVAAPYVVPYSAALSFERQFSAEHPTLYKCLHGASSGKVSWKDVMHWMWPLFTERWGMWRCTELNLSPFPLTDPVTGLTRLHDWPDSPLVLYGFSDKIVECPDYWPGNTHACGFWFLPCEWQFSCKECRESVSLQSHSKASTLSNLCISHFKFQAFLENSDSVRPIFLGLSSIGSMGFLKDPYVFLRVIERVIAMTNHRFVLFTAGYEPLDEAVRAISIGQRCSIPSNSSKDCVFLFQDRLLSFSGMLSYKWLFQKCSAAIHHGGSGTTAAALHAGIPQVVCPFIMDQFYWAEKMHWLGVAPPQLPRHCLIPDNMDDATLQYAASMISTSLDFALSLDTRNRAVEIATSLSSEDGLATAVRLLKHDLRLD